MSEDQKKINLMPLCAAFNLLQLDAEGTTAVNIAAISYVKAKENGSLEVGMQGGKVFMVTNEQANELVDATRRALEQAHRQAAAARSGIIPAGVALPKGM